MQSQLKHLNAKAIQRGNNCPAALWTAIELSSYDRTPEGFTPGSNGGVGTA